MDGDCISFRDCVEWAYYGRKILELKPEATLWDLFKFMYVLKTGNDFPVHEEEGLDLIIKLHYDGLSTKAISEIVGLDSPLIIAYLDGAGLGSWRFTLSCNPKEVYQDYRDHLSIRELMRKHTISYPTLMKIVKECEYGETAGF